jgi:hypothetical protein
MRLAEDTKIEDIIVGAHRRSHIVVAIPTLGMVPIEFVVGFGRLQFPVNGVAENIVVKNMEVGDARNYVVREILKRPKDQRPKYIFFIGDDMIPPWDGLLKLHEEMESGQWDWLTGLYYWKGEPPTPLTWRDDHIGRLIPGVHFKVGEVIWVDLTGLDFTLLKVETLEKIDPPWFKTGPDVSSDKRIVRYTEDVYFAKKMKKVGGRIGVHTGVRVAHIDVKSGMIY